ncbi:MAG: hypothetical protein KA354_16720 [Phycisphaerae bacterium]|nr:hypothetical protein [Phycisphaerae bacterium]
MPPDLVRTSEGATPCTPGDSGLCCLSCQYNLTGLTENRCPECGREFDPEALRRIFSGEPQPIPGWDDGNRTWFFLAFFRVCWMTWFHPVRFAQVFPWCVNPHSALSYWFLTRTVMAGLIFGVAATGLFGDLSSSFDRANLLAAVSAGVSASLACEAVLVFLLELASRRRITVRPQGGGSVSWWAFVGFHGGFLIMSTLTVLFILVTETEVTLNVKHSFWERLVVAVLCVDVAWWWYCLGKGVAQRTIPTKGRILVICLIPAVGAGAILLGIHAAFFYGFRIPWPPRPS